MVVVGDISAILQIINFKFGMNIPFQKHLIGYLAKCEMIQIELMWSNYNKIIQLEMCD